MILDCYTHGFAQACRKAGGWYGLDLFAGTGKNYSTTRLQEMRGSPLILLEAAAPRANKVLFSKLDPGTLDALRARCEPYGERACIFPAGDANQLVHEMLAQVPVKAPTFAFLDPEGAELEWPTVAAIARHKQDHSLKIEQLILSRPMGFIRLMPDYPEKVDTIFGHGGWRHLSADLCLTKWRRKRASSRSSRTRGSGSQIAGTRSRWLSVAKTRESILSVLQASGAKPLTF